MPHGISLDFVIKFEFLCIYSLFSFQGTNEPLKMIRQFKKNLRKVLGGELGVQGRCSPS
jgi:hypothetical protein